MSLVFNMVGGGGGSLKDTDAIMTVTVPTGSSVTMTKGSLSLTPTMWVQAADPTYDCALFVIKPSLFDAVNAWTVNATLGTDTTSDTVTISSNKQYDMVFLSYHVPNEYQEVEYIAFPSSGAYINTLINANTSRAIEIKISDSTNRQHYFGGSENSGESYQMAVWDNRYYWGSGSSEASGGNWSSGVKVLIYNDARNNYIPTVNGNNLANSCLETTRNFNILLGKRGNSVDFSGKIYYCFIRNNSDSSLAFEAYPCYRKSDSVAGIWDKVSKRFCTNAGSGTFTVGPDVRP